MNGRFQPVSTIPMVVSLPSGPTPYVGAHDVASASAPEIASSPEPPLALDHGRRPDGSLSAVQSYPARAPPPPKWDAGPPSS